MNLLQDILFYTGAAVAGLLALVFGLLLLLFGLLMTVLMIIAIVVSTPVLIVYSLVDRTWLSRYLKQ